ncbi:MAG: hypothetical protein AAF433_14310 [Bacteroidota bacterium]
MPTSANDPTRNPHPLPPDGRHQGGRLPAALASDYVLVDEKSATDWVELARRLARHLNYFDATNTTNGDWSPFYDKQPVVAAARLLAWPFARLGQRFAEYRELIEDQQGTIPKIQLLHGLFDLLSSTVVNLDRLTDRLVRNTPLRNRAEALIEHQLAPAFARWLAYYRAAAPVYFTALGVDEVPTYLRDVYAAGGELLSTQDLIAGLIPLDARWTQGSSWSDYLLEIGTDELVYGDSPVLAQADQQIIHALGHVFFHGIYEAFVSSGLHLATQAMSEWQRLQTDSSNAPHLALLLAFLEMREQQRSMLNALSDQHLDFYYRRSLRTQPASAVEPRAFLALEARKNLPPTYLPEGSLFRGGKDEASGLDRQFSSTSAITVGLARLVEQRAIFKVANDPAIYDFPGENRSIFSTADRGRLYAATQVTSLDGLGEEDLPEDQQGWYPFGHQVDSGGQLQLGMQEARIGLAVASHYLYLKEGSRTITFQFTGFKLWLLPGIELKVLLTTEEGWLEKRATINGSYQLVVSLTTDEAAILPYNEEIHQQGLPVRDPVARIELAHDAGDYAYHQLRQVKLSDVYLGLVVNGVRELALSGSAGVIDSSQPFFPFGPAPVSNEVLHVGSKEVFQKAGADLNLNWAWKVTPANQIVELRTLRTGTFTGPQANIWLNNQNGPQILASEDVIPPDYSPNSNYQAGAPRGYLRLRLLGEWGHSTYASELAQWTSLAASGEDMTDNPIPPPPPELQFSEIYFDYEVDAADLTARSAQRSSTKYFHLTPFGVAEPLENAAGRFPLFPEVFANGDWSTDAAALYLGFENWEPGSQLSLLIQIEEGTADPLLEKPDNHLNWHYLDDNDWQSFPAENLQDNTDGLLRSGLVRLDLPANVKRDNLRFGDGLSWLRLSVNEKTAAVNRIRGIHPHGVEVVQIFEEGQSATNEPLPAATISSLTQPLAGIKKVEQFYPSFVGSAPESRDTYFSRLSERLRHKDRGITEWDVEHLILQAFPEVERIICLQHVEFRPLETPGSYVYHELRAGHFTVIPLGRSGSEGLRPYLSLSTREQIESFLLARISCQATLHLRNPLFEEVQVVTDVKFLVGTDEAWALGQIQLDIIDFISPWHDEGLAGLDFDAEVHQSAVVNFIEELPYVDYVKNLILKHLSDASQNGSERIKSTKLVSVLAAAPQHLINPVYGDNQLGAVEVCTPVRRASRRAVVTITDNPID